MFVMHGSLQDFLARAKKKRWPIDSTSRHRHRLDVKDTVVFYLSTDQDRRVMGTTRVASKLLEDKAKDFFIKISDADLWKEPANMEDMVYSLEFILNKKRWTSYLQSQGGVVWLNDNDFNTIISYKKER